MARVQQVVRLDLVATSGPGSWLGAILADKGRHWVEWCGKPTARKAICELHLHRYTRAWSAASSMNHGVGSDGSWIAGSRALLGFKGISGARM